MPGGPNPTVSSIGSLLSFPDQLMREEIERKGDRFDNVKGGRHLASLNRTYRIPVKVGDLR